MDPENSSQRPAMETDKAFIIDFEKGTVSFSGDPDKLIKEDYLRIIRYFRYYSAVAEQPCAHRVSTLEVLRKNAPGLKDISGKEIWNELKDMLQGNFPGTQLRILVLECGAAEYIGLHASPDVSELRELLARTLNIDDLHPISYLVALMRKKDDVTVLGTRLQLSGHETFLAYFLMDCREATNKDKEPQLLPDLWDNSVCCCSPCIKKTYFYHSLELFKYNGEEKYVKLFVKAKTSK